MSQTLLSPETLAPPRPQAAPAVDRLASVYRVLWRWHFYAGMIVAPVVVIMSLTGAIYVFKDEVEGMLAADLHYVTPAAEKLTLDEQIRSAEAAHPSFKVEFIELPHDAAKATRMTATKGKGQRTAVYVNPYDAGVLGAKSPESFDFFEFVLKIHRTLYLGSTGRVIVELTTSWMIVLLITGLYLWWPSRISEVWGVWLVRVRARPYTLLRDLHAVSGAIASPVLLIVTLTGLFWAILWSPGFKYVAADGLAQLQAQKRSSASAGNTISVDQAVAVGRRHWPEHTLSVAIPKKADDPFVVRARTEVGPTLAGLVEVDRYTGSELRQIDYADLPALARLRLWIYPLHVGSVYGLPTKILAFLATMVAIGLTITGVWMWWKRRPPGTAGFPAKPSGKIGWGVLAAILGISLYLPMVALSIAAILLGEGAIWAWRRRREKAAA